MGTKAPAKTTGRRLWILVILVLALPFVLAGGLVALLASDAFLSWAAPRLSASLGFELGAVEIRHELGSHLSLREASFGWAGEPPLARVRSIDLRYRLWPLLSGRGLVVSIELDGASVELVREKNGSFAWSPPAQASETSPPEKGKTAFHLIPPIPIPVRVERLAITSGAFLFDDRVSGKRAEVGGIGLEAQGSTSPTSLEARLQVERASYEGESLGPLMSKLRLQGDKVLVDSFDLAVRSGSLGVAGEWDAASGSVDARASLDRLDLAPMLAAFGIGTELPGPLTGRATLAGRIPDSVSAHLEVSAPYRGEDLRATATAEGAFTNLGAVDLDANWSGLSVKANGRLDLEGDGTKITVDGRSDSLQFLERLLEAPGLEGERLELEASVEGALAKPVVEIRKADLAWLGVKDARVQAPRSSGSFDGRTGRLAFQLAFEDLATLDAALGRGTIEAKGTLDRFEVEARVGSSIQATGAYEIPAGRVEMDARIEQLVLDPFLRLAGLGDLHGKIGSAIVLVAGTPSDLASISGHATLEGLEIDAGGERLSQSGPLGLKVADGSAHAAGSLEIGQSHLTFEADLPLRDRTVTGALDARLDLADVARFARGLAPGIANAEGTIVLRGSVAGALDDPRVVLEASARDLSAVYLPARSLGDQGKGAQETPAGTSEPETAPPSKKDPGMLSWQIAKMEISLAGPVSHLSGTAEIEGAGATGAGREVRNLAAHLRARDGSTEIEALSLEAEGVKLAGHGKLGAEGRLSAEIRTEGATLERIPDLAPAGLEGELALGATVSGTIDVPQVVALADVPDVRFRGSPLGALHISAELAGPRLTLDAGLPGGGTLRGSLDRAGWSRFTIAARIPDLLLDPYLRMLAGSLPPALGEATGRLALRADLEGALDDLPAVHGSAVLEGLDLTAGGTSLHLEAPATVGVRGTTAGVERARFLVGSGSVEAAGTFAPDGFHASVKANLDPSLAGPYVQGMEIGPGSLVVDATIESAAMGPLIAKGRIDARVDSVSVRGYAYPVEQIRLAARFEGSEVTVESLDARIGDGEIHGEARGSLSPATLTTASISFVEIPYRIPDTLRVLASGQLSASGSPQSLLVAGKVHVDEALYERDVQVLQNVIQPIAGPVAAHSSSAPPAAFLDAIRLDLKIESGEDLRIRNNIARILLASDLQVGGTAADPRVLGRIRVAEGTLELFLRIFQIERGTIDFEDPFRIDPRIEIVTRTTVDRSAGNVDVELDLAGTVSQGLRLVLTSVPSFSQEDIAFLLITGKTREETLASGGGGGTSLTGLSVAALGLIGGDRVKKSLGLTEFGLAQTQAGAVQVTVGKRLSDRLAVRSVNDVGGQATNVALAVEYQLTEQVLLVAEPQSTGAFDAQVRFRFRFR